MSEDKETIEDEPTPFDIEIIPTADQYASMPIEDDEDYDEDREYTEGEMREDPITDLFLGIQDALAKGLGAASREDLTYEEFNACRTLILMGLNEESILVFAEKIPEFQKKRVLLAVQENMKMKGMTPPSHLKDEASTQEPQRPSEIRW